MAAAITDKCGLAILIGNSYADNKLSLKPLDGPELDIQKAEEVFSGFGGECLRVINKSAKETKKIILDASRRRYPQFYKWIVVLFCGHGKDVNSILANDGGLLYLQPDVIDPFQPQNAPEIAQIPKLFFFDTCRGDEITKPILVPRGSVDDSAASQISRGGGEIESLVFPPEGNMLVAMSTLPKQKSYELPNKGGLWISKVLAKLQTDSDKSVTDVLSLVNKDILKHYQEIGTQKQEIQQPEWRCTLLDIFKFRELHVEPNKCAPLPSPPSRQISQKDFFLQQLGQMMKSGAIKKKDYIDQNGPGHHVSLTITRMNGTTVTFSSDEYSAAYKTINDARERVAQEAIKVITEPLSSDFEKQQSRSSESSGADEREPLQALRDFLEQKGFQLNDKHFTFQESPNRKKKHQCTISHEWFQGHEISGGWCRTKKEAKQSAARNALEHCH